MLLRYMNDTSPPEGIARSYPTETREFDVCVVGGGMAGICAAIAAARRGAKTALVHDRPVLGGNASSEVRMHVCGAHGANNKETGIIEEIMLENQYRNAYGNYPIWDGVLFEKTHFCPNLTPFLNYTCCDAEVDGSRIVSIKAWGLATQTWRVFHAKQFIDCSGDSVLAPLTGALVRWGRESREEFGEDIAPNAPDRRTMGNSILLQTEETAGPQAFIPPRWAYRFEDESDIPHRLVKNQAPGHNFWWIELGGMDDTIYDSEEIRIDLMKATYGVWDYLKNRGDHRDRLANWRMSWIGALPGKRENRRYVGDHILAQNDIRSEGRFEDIVAYGGWSMDDHHPAGLLYPGKPTLFHKAPSPYGIPYRSLYSKNVDNLFCAGRNISATHTALSSTRVMATCAVIGQAVGTASALCVEKDCLPRNVCPAHLKELQTRLLDDDCWLPGLSRECHALARQASLGAPGEGAAALLDGHDRPIGRDRHCWRGELGSAITLDWKRPVDLAGLRLVFDSDLNDGKTMPFRYPLEARGKGICERMIRRFRVEGEIAPGRWETIYGETNNYQRLVTFELRKRVSAVRLVPEASWGSPEACIYSIDTIDRYEPIETVEIDGSTWHERVAAVPPEELEAPDSGLEKADGRPAAFGA